MSKYTAIFAHQEFKNAKMGAITSLEGDEWDNDNPLVISGHVHDYDHLQPNLIYTGTPMQHAFGDTENKTISYYTYINIETIPSEEYLTFIIPNIDNIYAKEDRIDLKLPRKRIFYINCDQIATWNPPDKGLIKVVIRGTPAEIKATMKLKIITEWENKKIKIVPKAYDEEDDNRYNNIDTETKSNNKINITSYYEDVHNEVQLHDKYVHHWHYKLSK